MIIQSFVNRQPTKSSARSFVKKNPYTGEEQHQVRAADLMEAVSAIQTAQKFFGEYKQETLAKREELIRKIKSYIETNKLNFARFEAQDQGLPLDFVLKYSIDSALNSISQVLVDLVADPSQNNHQYSAAGVVALITSWNLSFRLVAERLIPAIAAGNTVVVKISSMSPITAVIWAEIIEACDLPSGLIQILVTDDEDVKKFLITHPGVRAISFVGNLQHSSEVMKAVTSVSLQQFKKIQISSGSKNTAAVLGEPTDHLFPSVMDSFLIGQGQLAWNSTRLFMIEKNEKLWLEKIKDSLAGLKPAASIEDPSPWTPVLKPESYKTFAEINVLAVADQARLIKTSYALSDQQKNCFLPITFTQDMSNCSTLQQDQVMSPLFILSTVKYPFDIQKYSNVSYFGLAAHLWGDEERLQKVADSLEVGRICKNKWSVEVPGPAISVKQSGFGLQDYRTFGDFYSNAKILT